MTGRDRRSRAPDVLTACFANAVEWYDFAVYGAMASVLSVVLLAPGSASSRLTLVFAVFAASFLARPVGAVVVGLRADRLGRRRALAAMVLLMTGATAAIGVLPPWSAVGVVAPICLLLLRTLQGFASGGEISTSITFLVESGRRGSWGWYAGWHTATVGVGIAAGITIAGLVSGSMTKDALESWGWRVPFLVALPLGVVGLLLRLRTDDTPAFDAMPGGGTAPNLRQVWDDHRSTVRTGFVLVGVLAATFNMWFLFLPAHLATQDVQSLPVALGAAAVGLLAAAVSAPLFGRLSDRVGRLWLLAAATATLAIVVVPLYLVATDGSVPALVLVDVVVGVALGGLVVGAYLAEAFPAEIRATGVALTYGLATAVLGGTAPLVGTLLARTGSSVGVPGYLAVLSAAGLVAVLSTPHTVATSPTHGQVPHQTRPSGLPATGDAAARSPRQGGGHGHDDARARQ
jgi:MFS transporter, MHS family, proline/betaine transporter